MDPNFTPIARNEELVVQEMPGEVLVYDIRTNQAHCLNTTAAFIWKNCTGANSIRDIEQLLMAEHGTGLDADLVKLGVEDLASRDLLSAAPPASGLNRRDVIKRIGMASVIAIPVIASLAAPKSALASTSCTCQNSGQCVTQGSCPSTTNCNTNSVCAP
ncbi:MAG: PqqD family protein [Acidobacteria bacterium]|nr:PqqD family protein [Acidobacteriota bacterium]